MQVVKICRECGEEYRPEILRCADCGGELETRFDEERTAWPRPPGRDEPAPDPRPAGDYQPIAWSGHAAELTPLADRLVEAGIPFYLRPRASEAGAGASGYEVSVRQEEREAALREIESLQPVAAASPEPGRAPESCPACGHALSPGVLECPDCGLAVGETPE